MQAWRRLSSGSPWSSIWRLVPSWGRARLSFELKNLIDLQHPANAIGHMHRRQGRPADILDIFTHFQGVVRGLADKLLPPVGFSDLIPERLPVIHDFDAFDFPIRCD